ncbi:MAG: gamma-glutamyl-gamma-aminobutyrate hydrolase family protein [Planctomycetota bacterium]
MRVLLVDHRDSFTWNLVQFLEECGAEVRVVGAAALRGEPPPHDRLLLGPGPGGPDDCTDTSNFLARSAGAVPTLGVCLGHQVLARRFGGAVGRGREPVHGFAEPVHHDARGLFAGLPTPLACARYHSLVALEPVADVLEVSARAADGTVMALRHRELPIESVQFHPESVLSEHGHALLSNFLSGRIGSLCDPSPRAAVHSGQGPDVGRLGSGSDSDGKSPTTPR